MLVPTQQALGTGARPDTAADRLRLDQGKKALKQLLEKKRLAKSKRLNCGDYVRIYGSVLGGLMIIFGFGILLFLVPMKIDPAWATLTFEFNEEPVLLYIESFEMVYGIRNISWCSCTEGCTRDVYTCYQIIVSYRNLPEGRFITSGQSKSIRSSRIINPKLRVKRSADSTEDLAVFGDTRIAPYQEDESHSDTPWADENTLEGTSGLREKRQTNIGDCNYCQHCDVCNASLYVNIKGCGYPPVVNCSFFRDKYGQVGRRIRGYYSSSNPYVVLGEYEPERLASDLRQSLGYTIGLLLLGVLLLCLLQAPYAKLWKSLLGKPYIQQTESLQQFRAVAQHYTRAGLVNNMSRIAEKVVKINRDGRGEGSILATPQHTISTIAEGSADNTNSSSGVSSMTSTRGFPSVPGGSNAFNNGPPAYSWHNMPTVQPFRSERGTGQYNDAFEVDYDDGPPYDNRPFPSSGW